MDCFAFKQDVFKKLRNLYLLQEPLKNLLMQYQKVSRPSVVSLVELLKVLQYVQL